MTLLRPDLPASHVTDAFELESKGYRDLFKIELTDGSNTILYITAHNTVNYIGQTWEFLPSNLSDNAFNSSGEQSRPKFSIINTEGLFSTWIESGAIDGAIITRLRVQLPDLAANIRSYTKRLWVISKVLNLNKDLAVFELRSTLDGVNFQLPARSFYPPDFPHVSV